MNKKANAKLISLLLALMMIFSVFAGCSDSKSESKIESNVSSAVSTVSSEAADDADTAAQKTVTVQVVHKDGTTKDFEITTSGATLREALDQESLVEGEESQYGLYIKTVDGETADDSNQEWWCVTKGGEMTSTGVDGIEIADGDTYELTLTVGY